MMNCEEDKAIAEEVLRFPASYDAALKLGLESLSPLDNSS